MPPFTEAPVRSGTELGFPNKILNEKLQEKHTPFLLDNQKRKKPDKDGSEREEELKLRWPKKANPHQEVCFPLQAKRRKRRREGGVFSTASKGSQEVEGG